ncbi:MAG: NPCBM/NEW2 domain-containing protein [Sedimentisphaerales bacterium]|nr:NPCBM/NEW2 domain-containing protein [Sedimentisphaerales bacterium]
MKAFGVFLIAFGTLCQVVSGADGMVTADEMAWKAEWVKSHILAPAFGASEARVVEAEAAPRPGLDVYANNDPVLPNKRGDSPLRIGEKTYSRGLYCHAVSKVVVTLPGPGSRFTAEAGLDHNDDTLRGRGSVVFSVTVKEKVVFKSEVMTVKTPALAVDVDLEGATSFTLEIGDAGDGIGWDQSNWADAKAVLADGRQLWLGDMEIRDHRSSQRLSPIARSGSSAFAFLYNGAVSDSILGGWPAQRQKSQLDAERTCYTKTWREEGGGLEVLLVAVDYKDFPAVEWTVYFKNTGSSDTGIVENIQALDTLFARQGDGEFVLHAFRGDTCSAVLYEPLTETLGGGASRHFAPDDGRGTNGSFPYYKVQMPGGGILLAIGWPGQWASCFSVGAEGALRISAGQELTRFRLRPGEEVRSPLIAMIFWKGEDTVRAQNMWRRWMWAHNVPRAADGKLPAPILFGNTSAQFYEMINANEENQKYFIDRYLEEKIGIDFWWMDAGWYPCEGQWPRTGTWESDLTRFPGGLRAISDHALSKGVRTLVWFEPERVGGGWLSQNHPEWRLGPLLNLGNTEAWQWLVNHVDGQLKSQGIHLYRQDFNMSPLGFWRGNDTPDRQGITENFHVQGYLAYWDELRKRHPSLRIDSCASGGRRNDLETMRRAVPLHPTDYNYGDLVVKQAFHHSLFQWIPYYGSNTVPIDSVNAYAIRSGHAMGVVFGYDMRRAELDYDLLRKLSGQWRQIVGYFYGDYYPVLPYSRNDNDWIAWQFHDSKRNEGAIQAFRRHNCEQGSKALRLGGLEAGLRYRFADFDSDKPVTLTGAEAMENGLRVEIPGKGGAAVVRYAAVE